MATSNFLSWDLLQTNAESDATYLADTTRINGAATDAILPSPLFNKAMFQATTFVNAFAQMMVNKGFNINDSPFSTLVAVLTNVKTSADFEASMINVPYATSQTFDGAASSGFYTLLTGNVSTTSLINTNVGQLFTFVIQQDGTGNRTFPWPANLLYAQPICPQPNSYSVQQWVVIPNGLIVPVNAPIWLTASGLIILPPNPNSVVSINSNGNVSNQFSYYTEIVNASSGTITRNLYTAVGYTGFIVNIKNLGSTTNNVLVQPLVGGQTIDGFPNIAVPPFNSLSFLSNGVGWILI